MSRTILRSGLRHRCAQVGTCFSKMLVFSPQGCDSGLLVWWFPELFLNILCCSAHVFVHWSNGFCLVPIAPPRFSRARARFWNVSSWPEFFEIAPRVWCDGSYGAAHSRFSSDQKWLWNPLNFNNFVLRRIARNITCVFSQGFSLIIDTSFFVPGRQRRNFFMKKCMCVFSHVSPIYFYCLVLTCARPWRRRSGFQWS